MIRFKQDQGHPSVFRSFLGFEPTRWQRDVAYRFGSRQKGEFSMRYEEAAGWKAHARMKLWLIRHCVDYQEELFWSVVYSDLCSLMGG